MEILINELSLSGQFSTIQDFVNKGLTPFISVLEGLNRNKDIVVLKKQNFWESQITEQHNLYSLISTTDIGNIELRSAKIFLRNLREPFWDDSQKHNITDTYKYNTKNIAGTSLAESCERDKIVISFKHSDFSNPRLQILKNENHIEIDNLFQKKHYIEVAYSRNQITKCEYFERKFALGLITFLENENRFVQTNQTRQGQRVYKEFVTDYYWYLDNLHKSHYEVFNGNEEHIGISDLQGNIDVSKKVKGRTL